MFSNTHVINLASKSNFDLCWKQRGSKISIITYLHRQKRIKRTARKGKLLARTDSICFSEMRSISLQILLVEKTSHILRATSSPFSFLEPVATIATKKSAGLYFRGHSYPSLENNLPFNGKISCCKACGSVPCKKLHCLIDSTCECNPTLGN